MAMVSGGSCPVQPHVIKEQVADQKGGVKVELWGAGAG